MTPDERHELWAEWIDRIRKEVGDAHVEHAIWREMVDALDGHLPGAAPFRNHYARIYADAQAMTVRRLVDKAWDVQSLARLLIEVQLHRDVLTRERYIAACGGEETYAGPVFDRLFGRGSDRVCDEVLDEDMALLEEAVRPVVKWADSTVAHMLIKPKSTTYGQIHAALEAISAVMKRYYLLLQATDLDPVPSIGYDWKRPFRKPLFDAVPWDDDAVD